MNEKANTNQSPNNLEVNFGTKVVIRSTHRNKGEKGVVISKRDDIYSIALYRKRESGFYFHMDQIQRKDFDIYPARADALRSANTIS